MPRYLLDTNICIYIKNHRPPAVLARFSDLQPGDVAMSSITFGELCFGAAKSSKRLEALQTLAALKQLIPVLPIDATTSVHYGQVRQHLQSIRRPIGNNDLWIAAHALSSELILVSNHLAEFGRVPGLKIENWIRQSLGEPDAFRLKHRATLIKAVQEIVRGNLRGTPQEVTSFASRHAEAEEVSAFVQAVQSDLSHLYEGKVARYQLRLSEYLSWDHKRS
jgi:tRNA(fMet)-specific endonuclease VapC